MNARLLAIETKRSVGLWCFPAMVGLGGWYTWQARSAGPTLWQDVGLEVGLSMMLLAPVAAGAAAWAAGRDRRRRMDELLATTPLPRTGRALAIWTGSVIWSVAAFVVAAGYALIEAAGSATWGAPPVSPLAVGVLGVAMGAAVGYAVGGWLPSRFTAPLVAIGLFFGMVWMPATEVPWRLRLVSPLQFFSHEQYSVLHGLKPDRGWPISLWLLGLTVAALALVALRSGVTARGLAGLVAGVGLVVAGLATTERTQAWDRQRASDVVPYTPVCAGAVVQTCLHPAYDAALDRTAAIVAAVVAPVAGISGAPERVEQFAHRTGIAMAGTVPLQSGFRSGHDDDDISREIALWLVRAPSSPEDRFIHDPTAAQSAVAIWLLRQAGLDPGLGPDFAARSWSPLLPAPRGETPDERSAQIRAITAAAERFETMDPTARTAWFTDRYPALRAGTLGLEDLP